VEKAVSSFRTKIAGSFLINLAILNENNAQSMIFTFKKQQYLRKEHKKYNRE
jgi:hypothetical protein